MEQTSTGEKITRDELTALQENRLVQLLSVLENNNSFYRNHLNQVGAEFSEFHSLDNFRNFPFTTKKQLLDDQAAHAPFGTNLTFPTSHYTRYHQTSGTTGKPLKVLDTEDSWQWWGKCWASVLVAAGIDANDRIFAAFGFGPFIGFWGAVEGARQIGALLIPGGGQSSAQRLHLMKESACTAVCCTPSYAMRLVEVAEESGFDLRSLPVSRTLHAGEPGANVPATKSRIENGWQARCFDHAGASEIGAHSFECWQNPGGTHINESEFIAEVIDPNTGDVLSPGHTGELVLTNLGRIGFPVIRYRTGDMVKLDAGVCDCGRKFIRCDGGIIGRRDDMITVCGVNVYPSAIENLLRSVTGIVEFRCTVTKKSELDVLKIEIETAESTDNYTARVRMTIQKNLGLTPDVTLVDSNTLPRFDLKAKRFFDNRQTIS